MQQLIEVIRREGINLGNGILKVDSFVNHQGIPPHVIRRDVRIMPGGNGKRYVGKCCKPMAVFTIGWKDAEDVWR